MALQAERLSFYNSGRSLKSGGFRRPSVALGGFPGSEVVLSAPNILAVSLPGGTPGRRPDKTIDGFKTTAAFLSTATVKYGSY